MLEEIVLKKEIYDELKGEFLYLLIAFIALTIILKSAFYKENLLVVLRTAASIFWLFALPGYCAMLHWKERLDFFERLIVGIVFSAALFGLVSYYLGIIGLNIKYHTILLPSLLITIGLILYLRK